MKYETTIKSIRFNNELIKEINEIAKKENRSFSNMTQTLIILGLQAVDSH